MNYKLLLSINYKLFLDDADSFIKFIKDNDPEGKVGGFEIYFDDEKEEEKAFAKDLARLSRENGYIFNVHSRWYRSEDSYNEYLRFVNELALEYGKTITLTLHPVESENKQEAEDFSKNLFARLVQYIKEKDYKLDLCIENLNILHGLDRLAIVEVWNILKDIKELNFTHDIGHEIIDNKNYSKLYDEMLSRLRNVHIHNFNGDKDHYPIRKTDENIELYKDALRYLDQIGFNRAVVLEYAADYIEGETKEDILRNYIRLLYEYIEIHNNL